MAYDITATPYANLEFLSEHQDLIKTEAQTKIYFDNIDEGIDFPPLTFPGEEGRYFSNLSDKQVITTTSYYFAWPWRKTAVPEAMQRIWIAEAVANNVAPFVHISGFPDHRLLLGNAVRWMLGEDNLIQVKAPVTVDVMMQTQPATGRIMIHLINLTGKRPHSEFIPIRDIEVGVRFMPKRPPRRVLLASTAEEIPFKIKNGTVMAMINELVVYDIIVIEPKES